MSVNGGCQSKEKYGSNEQLGEHLDKQLMGARGTSQVKRKRSNIPEKQLETARNLSSKDVRPELGDERGC